MTTMEANYDAELERIQERGERFAKQVLRDAEDRYDEECRPMGWDAINEAMGDISGMDGAEIAAALERLDYIQAGAMIAVAAEFYWKRQCLIDAERALDAADEEARQDYMARRAIARNPAYRRAFGEAA